MFYNKIIIRGVVIMALVKCPECNKEISDSIDTCIHCGFSLKKQNDDKNSKVIIHSYREAFIVNPPVKIYKNNQYITEISKGQTIELYIDNDTIFTFKSSIRKVDVLVSKGTTTEIMLSFNRGTGSLEAITNIKTDDNASNEINDVAYNNTIQRSERNNFIWVIVGIGCLFLAFILIKG